MIGAGPVGENIADRLVRGGLTAAIVARAQGGPDVAELIHAATIAIVGEVPSDRLWHAVPLPRRHRGAPADDAAGVAFDWS